MARKQTARPLVRKPTPKIADSRRVRYGNGMAPARIIQSSDANSLDTKAVRFGNGMMPASLRK